MSSNKPHCFGKMKWILKYPSGHEPDNALCDCEYGMFFCLVNTRLKYDPNYKQTQFSIYRAIAERRGI